MLQRRFLLWSSLVAAATFSALAFANVRLSIPDQVQGPVYVSAVAPYIAPNGTRFAVHDGEWAAIVFVRPTELVPADHDLLGVDFNAIGLPMLVEGFGIFRTGQNFVPISTQVQGLGNVPVWFVRWSELQDAMADDVLLFSELEGLPSLLQGTASYFQEQNHFAGHQVSHLTAVARGTLSDGRSFDFRAVEVNLRLVEVNIDFH